MPVVNCDLRISELNIKTCHVIFVIILSGIESVEGHISREAPCSEKH
jgi:hypothetical protein